MPASFLHGVEVIDVSDGVKQIQTLKSSVIGIVGTAPDADASVFPLNTPVLVAGSVSTAAKLDTVGDGEGTLPAALDGILDQGGAAVVVVRVDEGTDDAETITNIIGGTDAQDNYMGISALLGAESSLGQAPRILLATGFSHNQTVAAELESAAAKLKAIAFVDADEASDDAAAITYATNFGDRVKVVYPHVKVSKGASVVTEPASARFAGVLARSDNDRGFWYSESNQQIYGIVGISKTIDFNNGDATSRANLLNEGNVATIINVNGYRTWGNRCADGTFLSTKRTSDLIKDSIQKNHLWAVDRGINKQYISSVENNVNAYLRSLVTQGAIIGGNCWADPDLNTAQSLENGQVYFNFDFTPTATAERLTFKGAIVNDYYEGIIDNG